MFVESLGRSEGLVGTVLSIFLCMALLPLVLPFLLFSAALALVVALIVDRCRVRHMVRLPKAWSPPTPEVQFLRTHDGVRLRYMVVRPRSRSLSRGRVVLLCQPLGQCGLSVYHPLLALLGEDTTFISWDYRGFFESDEPHRLRSVSVRDHANDASEILTATLGEGRAADVVVGHSMGVQVALEFCLLRPELCSSLVLLNGTSGHALRTGLQPFIQLPYLGELWSSLISAVLRSGNELRLDALRISSTPLMKSGYLGGVCSNRKTMRSYLRGFQELDAHSCEHLLWQRISSRLRNAKLVIDPLSSHATLIEHPECVLGEIDAFINTKLPRFQRCGSFSFKHQTPETEKKMNSPRFNRKASPRLSSRIVVNDNAEPPARSAFTRLGVSKSSHSPSLPPPPPSSPVGGR